jgi:hypothetical protein
LRGEKGSLPSALGSGRFAHKLGDQLLARALLGVFANPPVCKLLGKNALYDKCWRKEAGNAGEISSQTSVANRQKPSSCAGDLREMALLEKGTGRLNLILE